MTPVIARAALYCTDSSFSHFEVDHRRYLHNQIEALKKALYFISNDFRGKECLRLFITDIPLFIFGITLSICCWQLSFSLSKIPKCF